MGVFYLQSRYPDSFTMSRLSFSLVVLCLGAVSAAPSGLDNWFFELTVPYIPEFTVDGVTVNLQGNITHMFTDPDFTWDLQTTAKTATLSAKTTMLSVGHYKTSGSVEGMDISGEGEIAFELSGGASETLSYTSKSADSFCVELMSIRCKDNNEATAVEALRRAKFKFPGRQKIFTSKKWGFTRWDREEYVERRRDGSIKPDGTNV